ncbi:uncharacterized protein [Henckelia pumila]|uniref:uncharacterized protein isoform X2 n=1 Tax=Henckelia pumila TaxID=405737 RepID=UPI003C6E9A2E
MQLPFIQVLWVLVKFKIWEFKEFIVAGSRQNSEYGSICADCKGNRGTPVRVPFQGVGRTLSSSSPTKPVSETTGPVIEEGNWIYGYCWDTDHAQDILMYFVFGSCKVLSFFSSLLLR